MKSRVINLPDLSGMEMNPDYLSYKVSEDTVKELIEGLMRNLGETVESEEIRENCGLVCEGPMGEVLLYPDMHMPGIEIQTDLSDGKKGSEIKAVIQGKEMSLSVKKILVNAACTEETVAKKAGIAGVSTLEELKAHLKEKEETKNRENNIRMYIMDMHDYLAANAEADLDEEEASKWCMEQAKISYEENLSMGIDLRFTEEGDMLSEEETLANLAKEMRAQLISMLADEKFCKDHGHTVDEAGVKAMVEAQMQEAGIDDENQIESSLMMALANEYFGFVYETLKAKAEEEIRS